MNEWQLRADRIKEIRDRLIRTPFSDDSWQQSCLFLMAEIDRLREEQQKRKI